MILVPRLLVFSLRSGFSGLTPGILLQASVQAAGEAVRIDLQLAFGDVVAFIQLFGDLICSEGSCSYGI